MISRLYAFLVFLLLSFPIQIFAQDPESSCKQVTDIARSEMRAAEKKQMARFYKKTASEQIDVTYHRCEWTINPSVRAISGIVATYFVPKTSLSKVVLDLADAMIVDKVLRNGIPLPFTRAANTVIMDMGKNLPVGVLDSVSIQYHGVPPNTGLGSFTQSTHAGVPIIWTLSEPYGASDWWPCKNTLDDKIDSIDILITCPKIYKGISNGVRQSELLASDTTQKTTHWKHRYPMVSYLVCLAVSNYEEFNDSVRLGTVELPMQTFCYPESLKSFKDNAQPTLDALQLYHYTFGDYPFIREKYGHTQFSWGGGEEHQTNSFVSNPGESLCAHELAHQWFGDKITCGSWVDIWLNEGFATQLASIFMESRYPKTVLSTRRAEIQSITSQPGGSVKVDDTTSVARIFDSRLTYTKGSHLLYMLRWKLGQEVFLRAINAYQKDADIIYGFATTEKLKYHLEKESGVKLDSFFRQWFVGQGYPSYDVKWQQIGNGTVKIKMDQTTSHASVSLFQMPVALKFKSSKNDSVTVVVDQQKNGEVFIKNIGFIADSVFVDPEYWLISKNNRVKEVVDLAEGQDNVLVYPNPFRDFFNVMLSNQPGNYVDVVLYSVSGQSLFSGRYNLYQGKEFISIPVSSLAAGTYFLKVIQDSGNVQTFPLLKY